MDKQLEAINKWHSFCMNYPPDFTKKVWADNPALAQHFESKFQGYWDTYGATGAMNVFYASLTWNNRKKLLEWVCANHKSEQPKW